MFFFAGLPVLHNPLAQEKPSASPEKKEKEPPEISREEISESKHSAAIGGKQIAYTATAGKILLKKEDGTPRATFFFTAYTQDGIDNARKRPITFSFNGGPGSSSVWLHLGVLGPRRVHMGDTGNLLPPPYSLIDNEYSVLDVTDLVFIDPVSTGYSRAVPEENPKEYHGVEEDIESVGEFIRLYTTRYMRWASPKFLIGESYGTTRAAGLSGFLQDRHGLFLNGIMLVSSVLDFQTLSFDIGNDLPYILFLPTYTATAWYHKRLVPELQDNLHETLNDVEKFALEEYAPALMKGETLPPDIRQDIIGKLARYTGLAEEYIERTNLRIEIFRFTKELLRSERRTVGRLDSRFIGIDREAAGENFEYDPSMSAIMGPYTAMINDYVRRELDFKSDLPYEILTGRVMPWNYGKYQNQYLNVAETLRSAMTQNPDMKIYVANGYYDLATPYFATEYTFNHLGLDPSLAGNIHMEYFDAGHMMYLHAPSLEKLSSGLREFINTCVPK